MNKLQIFLGGSCNPTTWRQSVAIPYLELNGISYYNPQVDNWTPEVVHIESYAKENAQVLLFVIDCQTRSTVSIVESAFMAGENKNLVLVIYPFSSDCEKMNSKVNLLKGKRGGEIIKISGETISLGEFLELQRARQLLQCLVAIKRVPMFSDILQALKHVSQKFRQQQGSCVYQTKSLSKHLRHESSDELINELSSCPSKDEHTDDKPASSRIDCCSKDIYFSVDGDDQTNVTRAIISILDEKGLSYKFMPIEKVLSATGEPASDLMRTEQDDNNYFREARDEKMWIKSADREHEQAHIGSGCKNDELSGTTAQVATLSLTSEATRLAIEREIYTIGTSRGVLFVITNKCRGLCIMVLASHLMALFGENVVLCVQYLEEPCSIGGESLSETAIADYNRGRVYLCDYAAKCGVSVFSDLQDAIECCSRKCC